MKIPGSIESALLGPPLHQRINVPMKDDNVLELLLRRDSRKYPTYVAWGLAPGSKRLAEQEELYNRIDQITALEPERDPINLIQLANKSNTAARSRLALEAMKIVLQELKADASAKTFAPLAGNRDYFFTPATASHEKLYEGLGRSSLGKDFFFQPMNFLDRSQYLRRRDPLRHEKQAALAAAAATALAALLSSDQEGNRAEASGVAK